MEIYSKLILRTWLIHYHYASMNHRCTLSYRSHLKKIIWKQKFRCALEYKSSSVLFYMNHAFNISVFLFQTVPGCGKSIGFHLSINPTYFTFHIYKKFFIFPHLLWGSVLCRFTFPCFMCPFSYKLQFLQFNHHHISLLFCILL